jgi:hypothetical protein
MKSYHIITTKAKEINGVYRMAGKVKEIINSSKISEDREGSNYNGYGYVDWTITYVINDTGARKLRKFLKEKEKENKPKRLTSEEKQEKWCKRLVKLTNIDIEDAREIADEKLEYQEKQIRALNDRQCERYSTKRQKLINKIIRQNPLRRIEGEEHVEAILAASNRHNNSDYEFQLEKGRELAEEGEIDYSEVRNYARNNYTYNKH